MASFVSQCATVLGVAAFPKAAHFLDQLASDAIKRCSRGIIAGKESGRRVGPPPEEAGGGARGFGGGGTPPDPARGTAVGCREGQELLAGAERNAGCGR